MKYITIDGASFHIDFVKSFKDSTAFVKSQVGNISEWNDETRTAKLVSVWEIANPKKVSEKKPEQN